jgi:hypothetical protein
MLENQLNGTMRSWISKLLSCVVDRFFTGKKDTLTLSNRASLRAFCCISASDAMTGEVISQEDAPGFGYGVVN